MSRTRKVLPRYLVHTASGKGRAVWNVIGGRREKMLPGPFNSPESLQAFARLQLELASSPDMPARAANGPAVVEVLLLADGQRSDVTCSPDRDRFHLWLILT